MPQGRIAVWLAVCIFVLLVGVLYFVVDYLTTVTVLKPISHRGPETNSACSELLPGLEVHETQLFSFEVANCCCCCCFSLPAQSGFIQKL